MSFRYEHPRPALTVVCVVFGLDDDDLKVLLIRREIDAYKGRWALPGGFVRIDESLDHAARRELTEETGARDVFLEQLYTFGDLKRDPRGRTVSIAYYALVSLRDHKLRHAADAGRAAWFELSGLPELALDHNGILETAIARLRGKVRYQPIGFELLPARFTLTQLQQMYEKILERKLDKRNFRRKALATSVLQELDEIQQDVAHRAARLYRFDEKAYRRLTQQGFNFEL